MTPPKPDRDEFHGAIAEHMLKYWGDMPKSLRKATIEAVKGERRSTGSKAYYTKFKSGPEGFGIQVRDSGFVQAKDGQGRFMSQEKWKERFNNLLEEKGEQWK